MSQAESVLITPRRNFLVRALGFTAAGATLSVPIVTVASAEERLRHHMAGVGEAFRDLFPGMHVDVKGNCLDGHHEYYADGFRAGEDKTACAIVMAYRPPGRV